PELVAGERAGRGVGLEFERVDVRVSGQTVLRGIDVALEPGTQVAIVGPSGAGKSTLVGVLLGWHRPSAGNLRVDGLPLDAERLARLRSATAWVDPAVQLWNRSLLANLAYGLPDGTLPSLPLVIQQAELRELLQRLPEGLRTPLGEGGGLVSG